jgi:DNA-binding beta-propeller fold protein YncE
MKKVTLCISLLASGMLSAQSLTVTFEGTYATGIFDEGASEIVAYDPATQRLFSTNAEDNSVDIIDFSDPTNMSLIQQIDLDPYGDGVNSVAVSNGVVAVAVQADPKTDSGSVVLFNTSGVFQNSFTVGALPDMVTFTPDGTKILTANEGEPNDDYTIDPKGSVSIITLSAAGQFTGTAETKDFTSFDSINLPNVRIKDGATTSDDLEPEYISINEAGTVALITLQENNAVAVYFFQSNTINGVIGLGFKDHNQISNKLDASDRRTIVDFQNFANLYGMYMPDAITSFNVGGVDYFVTANEGDGREYNTYEDEDRVKDLTLDPIAFPNAATLQEDTVLGRLTVSTVDGDIDNDGDFDELYAFGARSFSIWSAAGALVYDSGDQIEQQVFADYPTEFNSTNDDNDSFKNRSDNKGPEPEAVEAFQIGDLELLAVGLERIGGFMIYDVSNPNAPVFLNYTNNRNFSVDADSSAAGDLGPESIIHIAAADSPDGKEYLVVANEVSGTISAFSLSGYGIGIDENPAATGFDFWPNPATETVEFSKAGNYTLTDLNGRVVKSVENSLTMEVSELPAGLYLLENENGSVQKLTIQ